MSWLVTMWEDAPVKCAAILIGVPLAAAVFVVGAAYALSRCPESVLLGFCIGVAGGLNGAAMAEVRR